MFAELVPSQDQQELQRSVRRFLADHSPLALARSIADGGSTDDGLWQRLTGELGLAGLTVAESAGGLGAGWPELVLVFEELGYALCPAPLLPTILATTALSKVGADVGVLQPIASGQRSAALALTRTGGLWDPDDVDLRAEGGLLTGTAGCVLNGAAADLVLAVARERDGLALYVVDGLAPNLDRTELNVLDMTRPLASLTFNATPARRVGREGDASEALSATVAGGLLALGAEQVGLAQRALDEAVRYAKAREQFGRPIGSFQAVKHMLASVLVGVESARSAVRYAAARYSTEDGTAVLRASMVKAWCSDSAYRATADALQVFGGIGYTWEHDAHLLFKRAASSAQLFGSATAHRLRVAELVGV